VNDVFMDKRGIIRDLFDGEPVHVTQITTRKGAVRGNHFHNETTQWTLVTGGLLDIASGNARIAAGPGEMITHLPGVPHAWKALQDTTCLVFTLGPRGEDYESDTYRLDEPLLT
jgi:quercetin dioxygenase-like cupin family protein